MRFSSRYLSAALAVTAIWLTGCDSLLETEAKGNITGDIYTDEESIQRALTGAYFNLGGINDGADGGELFGGDLIMIPSLLIVEPFEVTWDNINGSTYSDFVERNMQAINPRIEANWRRAYETINTLNSILENLDKIENASARERIEGEALAMRGILYFELVRLWGPEYQLIPVSTLDEPAVPLLLEPVDIPGVSPPRNTVGEVYTQVIEDLEAASDLLEPLGLNGTNLNYYTAQAYLMRAAMHMDDYAAALTYANNILSDFPGMLADSPLEAFNNTVNSPEDLFAIQQSAGVNSGNIATGSGVVNYYSSLSGQGLGAMRVSAFYLTNPFGDFDYSPEYASVDLRGSVDDEVSSASGVSDVSGMFYTNLLNEVTLSPSKYMSSDRVIPVVRLAEVMLTRAEALWNEDFSVIDPVALGDYNAIRIRAGLAELEEADFASSFAFYDSILVERRREFLYEGISFHDMKRLGQELRGIPLTDERFILPIPQSEQDAAN